MPVTVKTFATSGESCRAAATLSSERDGRYLLAGNAGHARAQRKRRLDFDDRAGDGSRHDCISTSHAPASRLAPPGCHLGSAFSAERELAFSASRR